MTDRICPCLSYRDAAIVLKQGGVIAYPTESVWGLGCDPSQPKAVSALCRIKQRSTAKGLILLVNALNELSDWLDTSAVTAACWKKIDATWPGPYTWTFPARADAPAWITGQHRTIAVRISSHPTVKALCDAWRGPIVSTSANRSGQPAAHQREAIDPLVLSSIDGIVAGETGQLAKPTSIHNAITGQIVRV